MNENPPTPPVKNGNGGSLSKFTSPKFIWPAAVVLAVLLYFGISYLVNTFTHESTDDAFIAGHIVTVAPRVAGQVVAVHVLDNELVHSNDLLVELDPADLATTVAQKEAAATSELANFQTVVAAYQLMQTKIVTAQATARKAQADAAVAEATARKSQLDFDRARDLIKQKTVSQQEFDAARAANDEAQANWKSAVENTAVENSKVNEADEQLAAVLAQKDMALAQFNESQTNVAAAKLNLSYTKIYAACDGRVTSKSVEPGDYLGTGQQIMSLVPEEVWVVANFKESQLKDMRPGQPVVVAIDALDGQTFRAHVDSIQAGSGAAFSLLPPENATGNFVKVVQRVPVKIIFDEPLPAGHVIGPGMSVTPDVQVSKFVIPSWAIALIAILVAGLSAWVFVSIAGRKAGGQ
jgi:membrane fusion protein (multidrug efflux system)